MAATRGGNEDNMLKLPKKPETRNKLVGVAIGLAVAVIIGVSYNKKLEEMPVISKFTSLLYTAEYRSFDLLFRLRGPLPKSSVSDQIVLLDYDDETQQWAPFPPDRTYYAEIIRALGDEKSKTAGTFFDIFFFDPFGRQLDTLATDIYKEEFNNLAKATSGDADINASLKENLYSASEALVATPPRIQDARQLITGVSKNPLLLGQMSEIGNVIDFIKGDPELMTLAPNRDDRMRDAIKDAGNVYLAQIVNVGEETPFDVDDILYDKKIHDFVARTLVTRGREQTRNDFEVKIRAAMTNLDVNDYHKLISLASPDSVSSGKKKPVKFTKAELVFLQARYNELKYRTDLAIQLNKNMYYSIGDKSRVKYDSVRGYRHLRNVEPLLQPIAENAAGLGYIRPELRKDDGMIRMTAPASVYHDKVLLHSTLILAARFLGLSHDDIEFFPARIVFNNCKYPDGKGPSQITIPLFEGTNILVNWAGTFYQPDTFHHRSFKRVYEAAVVYNLVRKKEKGEKLDPAEARIYARLNPKDIAAARKEIEFFKGKISLTGLTAEGTHDLNPTPFQPRYPLVGMHANVLNTILNRLFIIPASYTAFFVVILIFGVVMGLVGATAKQLSGALITFGSIFVYFAVSVLLLKYARLWIPVVPVVFAMLMVYLLMVVYRFMTEGQDAKKMKGMFATYCGPALVDKLIQNPDMLRLGGEKMDLTAMFVLASGPGLNTHSAETLVDRLNEYFTVMTDEIFRFDGTLDKYEGHIIMAIYGAPVHFDDHAAKACMTLVGMKQALAKLHEQWSSEGKGLIYTNVGVNSGPMIAGNMGSAIRFNYTIMGDAVNLSARILGTGKQYGVSYMISETTYSKAREVVYCRLIDSVVVVGKVEPANVYEVICERDAITPGDREFVETYEKGLDLYTKRNWDEAIAHFDKVLATHSDDKPSQILRKRCLEYKDNPPAETWKGEFVLTAKGM